MAACCFMTSEHNKQVYIKESFDFHATMMILWLLNHRKYCSFKFSICLGLLSSCFCFEFVLATTNITNTQFLRDSEALLSNNAIFKIGFFSPGNSRNRYVGIWYNDNNGSDPLEVVWVANRDNPLIDSSGVLKISEGGNLHLFNGLNRSFWSTNVSQQTNNNTVAQLRDNGNLVLLSGNNIIWESFEHLTDTLLPTPSLTIYKGLSANPTLRSWKNASDPSSGRFSVVPLRPNLPEFFIVNGDKPYWRTGPWNGFLFLGIPNYYSEVSTGFRIIDDNSDTLQLAFSVANQSILELFVLNYDGRLLQKRLNDGKWELVWNSMVSECQVYGKCGPFGSCDSKNAPICSCLKGFEPRNVDEWSKGNWTNGCVRRTPLQCGNEAGKADKFLRLKHMKVPDSAFYQVSSGPDDCERLCSGNCLCLAYAYYAGIGCMMWNVSLIDIQKFSADGADLFIRLAHSELDESSRLRLIIPLIVIVTALLVTTLYYLRRWMCRGFARKMARNKYMRWHNNNVDVGGSFGELKDLPLFKFEDLEDATNNFSELNKLGRGGFGSVYRGKLQDGEEVAVKRLSRASGQGQQEFMNEVVVISKLQHRNLVRLLGCCAEGEEKLLVYEYMPNKSLDALLFDQHDQLHLDWKKRFNIIKGIGKGLLYLHKDSRLKIIHRDLKASNILLDEELNPKISDFGLARIFRTKQDEANTSRVVGTYGYMSPEYAMEGQFSEKSDVFSFGVLLLEIISGKKNSRFLEHESLSLLTYAWKLWNADDVLSLINQKIYEPCFEMEMLRCIQLGLLCVQEHPEDRPSISTLITMLDSGEVIPCPKQPGFTLRKVCQNEDHGSVNQVSLTTLNGR